MNYPALLKLDALKQPSLTLFFQTLSLSEQILLSTQIETIDPETLAIQRSLISNTPAPLSQSFEPFDQFSYSGQIADKQVGNKQINEGKTGCIVLAGGQGTRLDFEGPKGLFPITICRHKSLFQLLAEKVKAASQRAGQPLPLAIMTSNRNNKETRDFFTAHAYFGLREDQVSFFIQTELPFLDAKGQLFMETLTHLAAGPDGNGRCLKNFVDAGLYNKWKQQGIRYATLVLIDNPLADPFDAELIGFHVKQGADVTLKCTEKLEPSEKVGVVVKQEAYCKVIEYSEMSKEQTEARAEDGKLKYRCANLSLFCFSMDFIKQAAQESDKLPLHKAWKAVNYLEEGQTKKALAPNAWKFETFIFDVLAFTKNVSVLLYPRAQCFAPLKNKTGADSPETVKKALQEQDRSIIERLTGQKSPPEPFELDPAFYYPTSELLAHWHAKRVSTAGYIEPFA